MNTATNIANGYANPVVFDQRFETSQEAESAFELRRKELSQLLNRAPTIRELLDNEVDEADRPMADPGWHPALVCDPLTLDKPKPTVADRMERDEAIANETPAQKARRQQNEAEQVEADRQELAKLRDTKERLWNVSRIEKVIDRNRWNTNLDRGRWSELKTALNIAKHDRDEAKVLRLADRLESEQRQRDQTHNASLDAHIERLKAQRC